MNAEGRVLCPTEHNIAYTQRPTTTPLCAFQMRAQEFNWSVMLAGGGGSTGSGDGNSTGEHTSSQHTIKITTSPLDMLLLHCAEPCSLIGP